MHAGVRDMGAVGLGHDNRDNGRGADALPLKRRMALLAGVASLALVGGPALAQEQQLPAQAQEQASTAEQQGENKPEEGTVNAAGNTVLDQITIVSKTGESAIDTMASVSHVDQAQIERRMAVTP